MKYEQGKKKSGFTIIESLVAVGVMLVAITGPMALMSQSIVSARVAKDRLRATYLAQEGLDMVRYHRDTGALQRDEDEPTNNWLENLQTCIDNADGCEMNPAGTSPGLSLCSVPGCTPLDVRTDGILTADNVLPDSRFTREVQIADTGGAGADEIRVDSTVTWVDGNRSHQVILSEILRSWPK